MYVENASTLLVMVTALLVIITALYAFATFIIALYAWRSHALAKRIKSQNDEFHKQTDEFREQTSDLYQAIVIATICSENNPTPGDHKTEIKTFKSLYKGKTPIHLTE